VPSNASSPSWYSCPASNGSARYGGEICTFSLEEEGPTFGIGRPARVLFVPDDRPDAVDPEDAEPDDADGERRGPPKMLDDEPVVVLVLGRLLLPLLPTVVTLSSKSGSSSSKSPSKTPSSMSILLLTSSRLSISTYSTASTSLSPRVFNSACCSRSRPYARLTCVDLSWRR